jgi:uncharacterized repeat protein (TIGR03803 family)
MEIKQMKRFPCSFLCGTLALALTLVPTAVFAQYTESILSTFGSDFSNGVAPTGALAVDASGNFYGALYSGGNNGSGAVFEASPSSSGYNVSILHIFASNGSDGAQPTGGLIIDAAGNLYGTTFSGGDNYQGNIFELSPSSSGWTFQTLYFFTGSTDGAFPSGALVFDASGNLYGTTAGGGAFGNGTVFKLTHSSSGWTEQVIYSFTGNADGKYPYSTLVMDAAGNLYGTADEGGSQTSTLCAYEGGCGTVFRLSPGSTWTFTTLFTFLGNRGANPSGGVIFDTAGNLYGTTTRGGSCTTSTHGCGVAFKLTPTGRGPWKQTVLHVFKGFADGYFPVTSLTMDAAGNLFGTSLFGTTQNEGSAWELSPPGTAWTLTPLIKFNGSNGAYPESPFYLDASGNLFTATQGGGASMEGTLLELSPAATQKH